MRSINGPQKRHSPLRGFARFSVSKILFFVVTFFIFSSCGTLSRESAFSQVSGQNGGFVSQASPETFLPRWEPFARDVTGGLAYCAGKVSVPRIEFHALRVDLASPELRIFAAGGAGGRDNILSVKVTSFVRDNNLLAGINALPFDPVSGKEGEPRVNVGLVIANGEMISPPNHRYDALVFYADGSGAPAVGAAVIAQSEIQSAGNIVNAVGGFFRILEGGEPVPRVLELQARHPRSAAGISPDGKYLYLLVIDGRRPDSVGATEMETALLLRSLGAGEGINFDGGGSSVLALRYPDGVVRAVNTPIHSNIPGRERAVAGCLGIGLADK